MSIISYSEAQAFLDDDIADSNTDFEGVLDAALAFVESYTRRVFDSASYIEHHNGNGLPKLFLNNYPITAIQRVAIGRQAAIRVCNTNTSSTAAVNVNALGVVLTYNGIADSTCTFANYATLTLLVAAINALSASGWSAELADATYGAYLSTELSPAYGKSCIKSQYVDLEIPFDGEYSFAVDPDAGILEICDGWPWGYRNVRVDYTAGYAEADMPDDLKFACKVLVKDWWEKRAESTFNITGYAVGGMSKQIEGYVPKEALHILDSYRRMRV
jgi:hypothetical protein